MMMNGREIDGQKTLLATHMFILYKKLVKQLNEYVENPDKSITTAQARYLFTEARSIFACALRTTGMTYVTMADAYGMSVNGIHSLALKGRTHCYRHTDLLPGIDEIKRIFNAKGNTVLDFCTKEFIQGEEKYFFELNKKLLYISEREISRM